MHASNTFIKTLAYVLINRVKKGCGGRRVGGSRAAELKHDCYRCPYKTHLHVDSLQRLDFGGKKGTEHERHREVG